MNHPIINSSLDLQRTTALLSKSIPSFRKAYSDRTAWLMACLSELAYVRFNPIFLNDQQQKQFSQMADKLAKKKTSLVLHQLIDQFAYDHLEEKEELKTELHNLNLRILETFDSDGTQAILVSADEFIVLAFRGTEAMSVKDIKSDLKAKMVEFETQGKIHSGFKEAYEKVEIDVQEKISSIDECKEKPLFITGHSLGGALATVAAKKLNHSAGIAACYTFGSPRVGDDKWIAAMKTPVYRLVNAADCVTMMPPNTTIITSLCWVVKRIPYIGETIRSWLAKYGGYLHCGDMRYLTNCKSGASYQDVELLFSVAFTYRLKGFVIHQFPWKKFLQDHSIATYRKKLMVVAEKRN